MREIGAISPTFSPVPAGHDRRRDAFGVGRRTARRKTQDSITIDPGSDASALDRGVGRSARSGKTRGAARADFPVSRSDALRLTELPAPVLMYEVISRLGGPDGFGEKGRVLNRYL